MGAMGSRKHVLTASAALVLMLTAAFYALAQQAGDAKKSAAAPAIGKRHSLAATLETVQWGWLDPKEPPKLTVDSGDTVSVETMMHSHDKVRPGITLDLKPFPGTLAVGIDPNDPSPRKGGSTDPMAPVSTLRPWKNGSNMDINELQEGARIFIPIFLKGGLVWTGDSHCRQGNGEVNLTALECAYREIALQLIVRKDMKLEWPRIETPTHWITTGFDEDLNKAMVNAVREAVDFLEQQKLVPLSRYEAYSLSSMAADCRVSQVVDVRKGVHCMIPKSIFGKKS